MLTFVHGWAKISTDAGNYLEMVAGNDSLGVQIEAKG
jgi:hypothetical protein